MNLELFISNHLLWTFFTLKSSGVMPPPLMSCPVLLADIFPTILTNLVSLHVDLLDKYPIVNEF